MTDTPLIDSLERRRLFAINVGVQQGDLYIEGTSKKDLITVSRQTLNSVPLVIRVNDFSTIVQEYEFSSIRIYGYNDNDNIRIDQSNGMLTSPVLVFGGGGDDTITTGTGNDKIHGDSGHDTIFAGNGNDKVFGDGGDDVIFGEGGRDTIYGGGGNDSIMGSKGNDYLFGEVGDDSVQGGPGDDDVFGGPGIDTLNGGSGNDDFDSDVSDTTDWAFDSDSGDNAIGDADQLV
jgi:Ca2+-binding RTX toxin-like protein